jgi:hypothetical protein
MAALHASRGQQGHSLSVGWIQFNRECCGLLVRFQYHALHFRDITSLPLLSGIFQPIAAAPNNHNTPPQNSVPMTSATGMHLRAGATTAAWLRAKRRSVVPVGSALKRFNHGAKAPSP